MTPTHRRIALVAGSAGFTGVALGAFGAHALKVQLAAGGYVETWRTAVLYHLLHAVALLALAGGREAATAADCWIARCWLGGIVCFSGSLYWMSLGGPRWLGPVTPLGGVLFLAGWALVLHRAWKAPTA